MITDTVYFWLDLGAKLWDLFVLHEGATLGCKSFKPHEVGPSNRELIVKSDFQLGSSPNKYRRVTAALDLMSLHFQMHDFSRPQLALALLALVYLNEMDLVSFTDNNTDHLRTELYEWAELMKDGPDGPYTVFQLFLEHFCLQMLPDSFDCSQWASLMYSELAFVSQFFLFPCRFQEHLG